MLTIVYGRKDKYHEDISAGDVLAIRRRMSNLVLGGVSCRLLDHGYEIGRGDAGTAKLTIDEEAVAFHARGGRNRPREFASSIVIPEDINERLMKCSEELGKSKAKLIMTAVELWLDGVEARLSDSNAHPKQR